LRGFESVQGFLEGVLRVLSFKIFKSETLTKTLKPLKKTKTLNPLALRRYPALGYAKLIIIYYYRSEEGEI
jgi:hypothetical protein